MRWIFMILGAWLLSSAQVDTSQKRQPSLDAVWKIPAQVRESYPFDLTVELKSGENFSAWLGWRTQEFGNWTLQSHKAMRWLQNSASETWTLIPRDTGMQVWFSPIGDYEYQIPAPEGEWGAMPRLASWVLTAQRQQIQVLPLPRPFPSQFVGDLEPCGIRIEAQETEAGTLLGLFKTTVWPAHKRMSFLQKGESMRSRKATRSADGIWHIEEWHFLPKGLARSELRWLCWDEKQAAYRVHEIQWKKSAVATTPQSRVASSPVARSGKGMARHIVFGLYICLALMILTWFWLMRNKAQKSHREKRWQVPKL